MASESVATELTKLLFKSRSLQLDPDVNLSDSVHPLVTVQDLATKLHELGHKREGDVLRHVLTIAQESPNHGGLGLNLDSEISDKDISEVLFLVSAWIESLNSADRAHKETPKTIDFRPSGRPPMTLTEKIFALHDVEGHGFVRTGTTIRVAIDWIMASEASWSSMETIYDRIGQPGIFRNDRFWLAGDHVVDPRVNDQPIPSRLIQASNRAKKIFKMTEFQGMNYTIMHTEFFRERAQPGAFIIGSDSHTCSAGANGCLSTGLGAADVTMGLVTGETWFKVPEVVNIRFVGQPGRGIGGKDVILYTLQQLKRNTVAADRVVEYTGPGLSYLSPDARFAIANMTTEFGGITGIFVPDHVTKSFIDSRKSPQHKNSSYYFRPDDDAVYAETHVIDLSKCEPSVAKYPNPDDVVPISEVQDLALDGCFIGACTTAEEDIILGALVLEQGLKNGLRPCPKGKRKVVPGSLPIVDMLRRTGLADVYEQAGFEIGVPSCSYCVGMSADRAGEGEVWLSSQNRNYPNRMGKRSFGNLASAATVAASSFEMKITNPQPFVDQIEPSRWEQMKGRGSLRSVPGPSPKYVEPPVATATEEIPESSGPPREQEELAVEQLSASEDNVARETGSSQSKEDIHGKVYRLEDFIDTDALAPAQSLLTAKTNEDLGTHCLEFTHPDFRQGVKEGFDVVVAGKAFGCGSSREQAVSALLGCGVKCVIARSFAFIYSRNQPSLGLLGITIDDDAFFEAAQHGAEIHVDSLNNAVRVGDGGRSFPFQLSSMEKELVEVGGITPAFVKFGKQLFDQLCSTGRVVTQRATKKNAHGGGVDDAAAKPLQW